MAFPGQTLYRSELPHPVLKEFDEHNAGLNQFLSKEHGAGGNHTNVTALSITTDSLTAKAATILNGTIHGALSGAFTGDVIASTLRLNPYKRYNLAPTDATAFVQSFNDPTVSLWYAEAAQNSTVNGIFIDDPVNGRPGHLQVIINNSTFTHTYSSVTVTNAARLYGCTPPIAVPPGGVIIFIYDGLNKGWRVTGSSVGGGSVTLPPNLAYTNVNNNFSIVQSFQAGAVLTTDQLYVNNLQLSVTGASAINQDVKTTASPTFGALTLTDPAFATLTLSSTGNVGILRSYGTSFGVPELAGRTGLGSSGDLVIMNTSANHGGANKISLRGGGYDATAEQAAIDKDGIIINNGIDVRGKRGLWTAAGWGRAIQLPQVTVLKWAKSTLAWGIGQSGDTLYVGYSTVDDASAPMADYPMVLSTNSVAFSRPYLYVGGFRVDVTANCTIPGSGGGAVLPSNLAYIDTSQHWTGLQYFDAGVNASDVTANTFHSGAANGVTVGTGAGIQFRAASGGIFYMIVTGGIVTYLSGIAP